MPPIKNATFDLTLPFHHNALLCHFQSTREASENSDGSSKTPLPVIERNIETPGSPGFVVPSEEQQLTPSALPTENILGNGQVTPPNQQILHQAPPAQSPFILPPGGFGIIPRSVSRQNLPPGRFPNILTSNSRQQANTLPLSVLNVEPTSIDMPPHNESPPNHDGGPPDGSLL